MDFASWIRDLEPLSLLIGGLIGAVLSTFLNYFVQRPRLVVSGGGSGGGAGPGFHTNRVTIRNAPGFIGIKIPETVLFGWRVHRRHEFGFHFERAPARNCSAFLQDKKTKGNIGLFWQIDGKFTNNTDIKSGESASLMLFSRENDDTSRYFVFRPSGESDGTPIVPKPDSRFSESRDFIVIINYSYNKRMRFPVSITKGLDGRLRHRTNRGGGTF